jgi:hypothetical protein
MWKKLELRKLHNMLITAQSGRFCEKYKRRRPDSNRGMEVLQTSALPLGYGAAFWKCEELQIRRIHFNDLAFMRV